MRRTQIGFTLVEIAIVLVIIGLLLGGVLKGQEFVNSAKVKNFAADFRGIPMLIHGYQDKFKALPGDDPNAQAHLGAAAQGGAAGSLGNGIINGDWFSTDIGAGAPETVVFWQHVRLANLAAGPAALTDPSYFPTNADGGRIGIESGGAHYIKDAGAATTYLPGSHVVCSTGILGRLARQLDIMLDDANAQTGSLRIVATDHTRGNAALATANIDDSTPYTVCLGA